jgi:hypothetical protein
MESGQSRSIAVNRASISSWLIAYDPVRANDP